MGIVVIKFNNGIELIGDVIGKDEQSVTMENIFQITYRISEHNSPVISLARFMMVLSGRQASLPLHEVFTVGAPHQIVIDRYHEACKSFDEDVLPYLENREGKANDEAAYLNFLELFPANPSQMQ